MDYKKEFDDLQSCMKNFNINVASELLSDSDFITNNGGNIIHLLGKELTEDNFKSRPDYFNFCEEHLLKMAKTEACQELIFDFLELIDIDVCKLSSSVLIAVTVLENIETPNRACLEYLLVGTFNSLNEMDEIKLKDIFLSILKLLIRLNKHFQHEHAILYYFARVAFLVLRANIEPIDYLNILSTVFNDPFCLLEYEFEVMEEKMYVASFFYLYYKTGMLWGPKIYNQFYVLDKCFNLALSAFENNNFGKAFAKLILTKYKDNEIPLYLLNKSHEEFLLEAAQSSVYNEQLNVRTESIETLMIYFNKLCSNAQYIVFKYTFSKKLESCIKAELIIKMKQLLFSKIQLNQDLGYFQGSHLLELVLLCCNIPDGPKCHVVENKEHILAAITLVYVFYAYKGNELNMGETFSTYVKQFVKTVQDAIDFTKEQYKLESVKLDDKNNAEENTYGYPKLSETEKRNILSQYNTTTILIESNLDLLKGVIKGF